MMKKSILVVTCALVLALAGSAGAAPISIADPNYLGYVDPGSPANAESEVNYINWLRVLAPGTFVDGAVYDLSRSVNVFAPLPEATTTGADSNNAFNGGGTLSGVTGFTYLLVKGGDTAFVWVLNPNVVQDIEIPGQVFGQGTGTSHYSLYNYSVSVPDGGMTLMLLGGALVGLSALRRKFRA